MTLLEERPQRTRAAERVPFYRALAFAVLVAVCWVVLFATAPSPTGEPVLRSTSPGNGETATNPDQVRLTFDRPVPAGLATVRVINPPGDQVVFERPVHPEGRADTIEVPMPETRFGGTYIVAWTLPSAGLEPIGGTFAFDVYAPAEPLGVPDIETRHDTVVAVLHAAARFGAVATFAVLAGAAFFVAAIWPAGAHRRPVRRLVNCSWLGFVLSTVAVLVTYGPYAAWAPLEDVLDMRLLVGASESAAGGMLFARLCVLIPATLALAQLMTAAEPASTRERWARGAAVLGSVAALAATWSLPTRPSVLNLVVDVVLLTAVAVLFGGLVLLAMLHPRELTVVPRFSRAVAGCAALLVVAGGYLAWRHGLSGSHGPLLAGLFALVALVGTTCWWLRGRARVCVPGTVRGPVLGALGAAVLALSATAVLVTTQPPRTAHAQQPEVVPPTLRTQAPPTRLAVDTGGPGGRGALDLAMVPKEGTGPGVRIDLHVSSLDETGTVKDGVSVEAVFERLGHAAGAVPVALRESGPGYLTGTANVADRGRWELGLVVRAEDGTRQRLSRVVEVR